MLQNQRGNGGETPCSFLNLLEGFIQLYAKRAPSSAGSSLEIPEELLDVELAYDLISIETVRAPLVTFIPDTSVTFGHQWSLKIYDFALLWLPHSIPPYSR